MPKSKCKIIKVDCLLIECLIKRENEVAMKVMQEVSVKQISADLHISIRTTQKHLEVIRSKVGRIGKKSLRRRLFELALEQNSEYKLPDNVIIVEVRCNGSQ